MFVGKCIRQFDLDAPTVWRMTGPEWRLSVVQGEDLLFTWMLFQVGDYMHFTSGVACSVHEAEVLAETAAAMNPEFRKGPCCVCGSSASSRRIVYGPTLQDRRVVLVCRTHEAVCRRHLQDPCPECDS